ncbi:penicillin-binding protein activator [Polymorphobacter glacialis]|uniref:Penicillin-binding protein activator n=1 Tax=Sandarakinorhabdus glacialis TaxID=1614636 RepID=A0A916ZQ00_9SPHN|nr:penicillin-binding protein activator [Polymorphobacter glacialis]GGE08293.1 penicillin-binding protein activator [Polymorphobacter glacialis]
MLHMPILKRRHRGWQAAPVIGATLFVAACATPQRPAVLGPPPAATGPATTAPTPLPEAQQNRVALLVPLTGANAPVGQSIANAANMALLDVGDQRVNLRVYDTTPGAAAAAGRALAEGATLVLGPLLAGDVRAVAAVTQARGVPVISFSNDSSLAGGDVFVLGFQPSQSIARTIAYAGSRGIQRFAALVPAGVYGQRAQTAFVRAVDAAGGRSTAVASYARDPAKMIAAARAVTAYDARTKGKTTATIRPDGSVAQVKATAAPLPFQALLIADSGSVAGQFIPALAKFGAPPGSVILVGTELWNNEPGIARAAALRGALFSAVPDDRFVKLTQRYRAKYGSTPSRLASFGYDSVLLVNSIAGNWALGTPFPRALLTAREGFAGIDGAFRFTPGGIAERGLEVQQIGNGVITTVSPAPRSFGS